MEKKKRDKVKTRQKILHTARTIFAKKGYDGARVDEIAEKADVNKSLIYYYFKSKKEILTVLIQEFFNKSMNRKEKHLENIKNVGREKIFEYLTDNVVNILRGDKEILKIIIIEELKSEKEHWPLFQLFDQGLIDNLEMFEKSGVEFKQKDKLKRAVFYFGLIPSIFFILLREEWSDYYNTDLEKDKQEFTDIMKKTYINFLKNELIE